MMRRFLAWLFGKNSGAAQSRDHAEQANKESGILRQEARVVIQAAERRKRLKAEERSLARQRR